MTAVKDTEIELPALLAMWLSLRLSEIRGLQYGDIKGDVLTIRRTVHTIDGVDVVREQTKTYNSTRQLRIPKYLKGLIGKGARDEYIIELSGTAIYKRFKRIIAKAELPPMRFHDLRHLNASVMLQLGIPDKYAMERGGWSTSSTLQTVYQHTFADERTLVDDKIDMYFDNIIKHNKTS